MPHPAPSSPQITPRRSGEGTRRLSMPDRRRIDSDVRAFLREPSTPWIVFDREGRPPSQLAVGEHVPLARVAVLSRPHFFPVGPAEGSAEPSSLAVAADLGLGPVPAAEKPARRAPGRLAKIGALAVGMVAALVVAAVAAGGEPGGARGARASGGSAPVPPDVTPPDLDPKLPAPASPAPAKADDARGRFGHLAIAGAAGGRDVFLDGKRLVGHGARSFVVVCGAHTIAVGTRDGARAVDVPCNAELLVAH
jgi:hypothetical protein